MADLGYDGKVAIITGAGGGLGRSHALELARRGARIVVNDLGGSVDGSGGDAGPAAKVVAEIEAAGGEAVADTNSVSTPEGGAAIVQSAVDAFGTVDIVVNNAGILRDKSFHNMTPELLNAVLDVHLKGAFNVTQPAWIIMREKGYGRIISTSSSAGILGNFGQTNYGAAKAGLMGMTFVWALELARAGITVNALAPAGATRMTANLFAGDDEPPATLDPSMNAPIVVYLASDRAAHVNGQIFGRTDFAYTIFQHPKQIAWMHREGGWDVDSVVEQFDSMLGQHLQTVGMVMPTGLDQDTARK